MCKLHLLNFKVINITFLSPNKKSCQHLHLIAVRLRSKEKQEKADQYKEKDRKRKRDQYTKKRDGKKARMDDVNTTTPAVSASMADTDSRTSFESSRPVSPV